METTNVVMDDYANFIDIVEKYDTDSFQEAIKEVKQLNSINDRAIKPMTS